MRVRVGKCETCAAMQREVEWLRERIVVRDELVDRLKTAGTQADRRYFEEEDERGPDEVLLGR